MAEFASLSDFVAGKLVLLALPPCAQIFTEVHDSGASDVLVLGKGVRDGIVRLEDRTEAPLKSLLDLTGSNCEVAILNSWAALALNRKRYFWKSRLETILVPAGAAAILYKVGLAYYERSGRLRQQGTVRVATATGSREYLVVRVQRDRHCANRRLFVPFDWTPRQIFEALAGVNYVLLRSIEEIETEAAFKDIDILVSDADLPEMSRRLRQQVGTEPIEVYSESGIQGHDFHAVPYYMPEMARRILNSAVVRPSGIRVPSDKWRYLALVYHLIFHGKSKNVAPDAPLNEKTYDKPRHYKAILAQAGLAGFKEPQSFDDLDQVLRDNGAFPSMDLIGFYARRNKFVSQRYLTGRRARPGLAAFFVRDYGRGLEIVPEIRNRLKAHFDILAEGSVNEDIRAGLVSNVRGGNWQDPRAPNGRAEPIHWFVCWDPAPKVPSAAVRRKHPHLDNEHIRLKDAIREDVGGGERKILPIVHSSDNSLEAIDHIGHLGLLRDPEIEARISALTRT